jgi:hypothetical protein
LRREAAHVADSETEDVFCEVVLVLKVVELGNEMMLDVLLPCDVKAMLVAREVEAVLVACGIDAAAG